MTTDLAVETPMKRSRKSRALPPDILALKRFCKEIDKVSPEARAAAIKWLADYYLGLKLWGF